MYLFLNILIKLKEIVISSCHRKLLLELSALNKNYFNNKKHIIFLSHLKLWYMTFYSQSSSVCDGRGKRQQFISGILVALLVSIPKKQTFFLSLLLLLTPLYDYLLKANVEKNCCFFPYCLLLKSLLLFI